MPDITKGLRVDTVSINDQIAVTGGTADPRSTDQGSITILPQGSLYISTTGAIYQKQSTSNLNWGKLVAEDFATGNVGIGNTSPLAKLHVTLSGTLMPALTPSTVATFQSTSTALDAVISIISHNVNSGILYFGDTDAENSGAIIYNHTSNVMSFNTVTVERMRIDSSGNVGIGTTTPSLPLEVNGTIKITRLFLQASGSLPAPLDPSGVIATMENSVGTSAAILQLISSTLNSSFIDMGTPGNTGHNSIESNNLLSYMALSVNNAERLRIDSTGNVGIGTNSASAKLHVSNGGTLMPAVGSTTVGIFQNTSATDSAISIIAGSANSSILNFGDTDSETVGSIKYLHSDNSMRLSTVSGSDAITISINGNIGMNLSPSPINQSDVAVSIGKLISSPGTNARILDLVSTKSGADEGDSISLDFRLGSPLSGNKFVMGRIACSTVGVTSSVNGNLIFYTMSNAVLNETMRINNIGSIGIGTATPAQKLSVVGIIESTTGGIKFPDATIQTTAALPGKFVDGTLSTDAVYTTGNVGIGTTSPGQKLDVIGNISVTGTVDGVDLSAWLNQSVKTNADAIFNSAKLNRLLVQASGSSVLPTSGNTVAILDNSGSSANSTIFVLTSGISGLSRISLGDPTDANESFIEYDNSTQSMSFGSNAAERIRINSSGNVGISTAAPSTPLHVKQSSITAAIPVETLEQLDTNEPFIEVLGTENATTGSILTGKTSHSGTKKFIKCKINGVVGYLQWSTAPI